ncbi:MAG: hypothetical protein IID16_09405 [Candidatus Marinimicrobia bacterium]|nr:hypothetical protein [Candidatus Neomarinimicrobiota bacterium]
MVEVPQTCPNDFMQAGLPDLATGQAGKDENSNARAKSQIKENRNLKSSNIQYFGVWSLPACRQTGVLGLSESIFR